MSTITFATGSITDNNFYTTQEVQDIFKLSQTAMDTLKRNGLPYTKIGRNHIFQGADIIKFIGSHKTTRKMEGK